MNEVWVEITAERHEHSGKPAPVGTVLLVSERLARRLVLQRIGRVVDVAIDEEKSHGND